MNVTNYHKAQVLNYVFGATAYTPPSNWYLGVSTSLIDEDGIATEPTDAAYARAAIVNDKTSNGWTTISTTPSKVTTRKKADVGSISTEAWGRIASIFLANTDGSVPANDHICYYADADPDFLLGIYTLLYYAIGDVSVTLA